MSIRLYFKPVSSLPTPDKMGISTIATKEANKAIQRVLHEQRSEQPPSKQCKCTPFSDVQRAKIGNMPPKTATLLLLENSGQYQTPPSQIRLYP